MKKVIAFLMVIAMMIPLAVVASASTTTLTTNVPDAQYTLNIPADTVVPFGAESTELEPMLSVTGENGFAVGKNLLVTLTYDAFKCEGVSTTIPFTVGASSTSKAIESGSSLLFEGESEGTVKSLPRRPGDNSYIANLYVRVLRKDWGKALAGEYTATITFTAEVVAGE